MRETIIKVRPVDKKTAIVMGKGEHYTPRKHPWHYSSYTPVECITYGGPKECDITGKVFGDFTVIGYLGAPKNRCSAKKQWLVKCSCGIYESKSRKALESNHPDNRNKCQYCYDLDILRGKIKF